MNNEIKNEKEREVHIEQSAKKEDVLSEQERDKKLAGTLAGKKPPQESDNDSGKDEGDKPPPTDNSESKGQPENPPKTDVHTEQTKTETQLEKLANVKVGKEVKKTGTETGGESNLVKPPADASDELVKGTEVQQPEPEEEDKISNFEKDVEVEPKISEIAMEQKNADNLENIVVIDNIENEFSSVFSRENFKLENSFDTYSKEKYPELNELKSKCVYDVAAMGTEEKDIDRTPKAEYTQEECEYLKEIREKVDAPTRETIMQKVICVDTGDIQQDLKNYLEPINRDSGERTAAQVYGFVAKAEDATYFTKTPQECHDNLRMDYPNTLYIDPKKSVYVIRFTDGINYDIPYNENFGGKESGFSPFAGNGFISAKEVTIPEYTVVKDYKGNGAIVTDGEIYRINPDGTEELVAYYDKKDKCFYLIEKEVKE